MAKKGKFKNFFSRMKKSAEKEKMKEKNICGGGFMCRCYRSTGVGFWGYGSILAMLISYSQGSTLFWTLIHGLLSWFYIFYKVFNGLKFF